eukprot:Pompholyxophrys_punicea_v1_NODE_271_length_2436_cov_24.816464.p1 type:complete len:709 gc:universal NODE_271_length_2436_cov_24.816464:251-2377(+)
MSKKLSTLILTAVLKLPIESESNPNKTLYPYNISLTSEDSRRVFADFLCSQLKTAYEFIKSDFSLHLESSTSCRSHWVRFALSQPDKPSYRAPCEHMHTFECDECVMVFELFSNLKLLAEFFPPDTRTQDEDNYESTWSELREEILHCISDLQQYQAHLVRSFHQRKTLEDLSKSLEHNECVLIMDWKMKILPTMYRESMKEFFGKAGLSLHGTAVIFNSVEENRNMGDQQVIFFDDAWDDGKQDAFAVLCIFEAVLIRLRSLQPHLTVIKALQTDCAGCYISQDVVTRVHEYAKSIGFSLVNFVHTESQNGKTGLDGHFAYIMHQIRLWVQEGHDVLVAKDLYLALQDKKITGSYPALLSVNRQKLSRKSAWPNIRRLSHYRFEANGAIQVWESSNIGSGVVKTVEWIRQRISDNGSFPISTEVIILQDTTGSTPFSRPGVVTEALKAQHVMDKRNRNAEKRKLVAQSNEIDTEMKKELTGLFYCSVVGCRKRFTSHARLQEHTLFGECDRVRLNIENFIKVHGVPKVLEAGLKNTRVASNYAPLVEGPVRFVSDSFLAEGWARKSSQKRGQGLSTEMKSFLLTLFNRGVARDANGPRGSKVSVAKAQILIQEEVNEEGHKVFRQTEWPSRTQIRQFFQQCHAKQKQNAILSACIKLTTSTLRECQQLDNEENETEPQQVTELVEEQVELAQLDESESEGEAMDESE